MKVCVATPYPLEELKGNSVTADRIVGVLREAGIEARASHGFDGEAADVLISLHAVKGAQAVIDFQKAMPDGKSVVLITGTDIYEQLPEGSPTGMACLESVDRIAVVSERSIPSLPENFRGKAFVVPCSLDEIKLRAKPQSGPFVISVVGHLRPVKQSFATIEAVAKHPEWDNLEVWQLGEALDSACERIARDWTKKDKRYRWFGGLPREKSLERCAQSQLTINSSRLEGGANAVLEAMTMHVPVLASDIEGNRLLLGDDYPGYFENGALDFLLEKILGREIDLSEWTRLAAKRLPLFSREMERACWLDLLDFFSIHWNQNE
ncbi:glycosyltransferase [Akkermansiaceae bacterium]|jgi:glycosyltransferase involved in cell wall biosynthesis|nr:glycosyltransferase [bacterium]MDB4518371.1 glycosyltransferase [Akkermansiaceae bacterium]